MENWITRDGGLGLGGWRTGRGFTGGFTGPLTETFSPERFERANNSETLLSGENGLETKWRDLER